MTARESFQDFEVKPPIGSTAELKLVDEIVPPIPEEIQAKARRTVCSSAVDAAEARDLMAMLGILPQGVS